MSLDLLAAGLAVGLTYAAISAGVAVAYVATRTLHLAVGTVAAAGLTVVLAASVTEVTRLPTLVAVLLGMTAAAALSALAYWLAAWRRSDPTIVLVGLAVAAALLDAAMATLGRGRAVRPDPLVSADTIAPEVLAATGGVVIALALHALLTRTRFGRRLRIAGASPTAASRLGIRVGASRTAAFAVAGAAAALATVLVAPVVSFGPSQAAALTVRGVAVAGLVAGGPIVALAGGVGLGLLEVVGLRLWPQAGGDLAVAIVVVGYLAVRGPRAATSWGRAW